MHANFLDPFQSRPSLVHSLDARVKVVLVVAFILTSALTPTGAWPIYVMLIAVIFSAEIVSELGLAFYMKRALLAIPFVLAALPVLFTIPGPSLLTLPFGLQLTLPGLERFISVALKSWISIQAAVLLASTTPFPDILVALRALRLPRLLVAIIGLMWRYLFVMVDETLRLLRARSARSATAANPALRPGGKLSWRARVAGGMAGSLFLRSLERSDRIYNAMLARGYDGEIHSLPVPAVPPSAWAALTFGLLLLAFIVTIGRLIY